MNNKTTKKLAGVIEMLIDDSSRINEKNESKYWYPLSMATYGVSEILEALDSMCSFRTTMWEKTEEFEKIFSEYQGCSDSIMVNSGSSADLLLSFLLREKSNLEANNVLVSAVTWPTQIWSLMVAGFNPILVDVDPNTLNIDYNDLINKIDDNTLAISLVHLMGNPCDMNLISKICSENNIHLIEDCCEGLGASFNGKKIGNFGLGGAFSFFFSHHITTMEGGMVTCNNKKYADFLKISRAHGWSRNIKEKTKFNIDSRYMFLNIGFNLRPTELQAGFGIHQMDKLDTFNEKRKKISNEFFSYVKDSNWLSEIKVHELADPSWLGLPLMLNENFTKHKEYILDTLEINGIETRPIVTGNIARHPVAELYPDIFNVNLPGADMVHNNGFYIGLSPMQGKDSIGKVIDIFKKIRKGI